MLRKLTLGTFTLSLLIIAIAAPAGATIIDPGLRDFMTQKADTELIPVLMVFDTPYDVSDLHDAAIEQPDMGKRRTSVIVALKKYAKKLMQNSVDVLTAPDTPGVAEDVNVLYFANALAFRGDAAMIEALGADKATAATLIYDEPRNLLDMTDARQAPSAAAAETRSDRADTVWNVRWVHADRVWNELGYTGDGVLVGHIDSGVWLAHHDISGHIYHNPNEIAGNGIDDDGNGYVDDVNGWDFGDGDNNPNDDNLDGGHGTHTAGTVCGDGANGTQTGVAPGAMLLVCKVFAHDGTGTVAMIWEGEQYAVEMGARVLTMSLGVKGNDLPASLLRSERANCAAIREAGVAIFNSSGNEHFEFDPPFECGMTARVPAPWNVDAGVPWSSTGGVVSVGGTGYQNNNVYSFSSQGPVTWGDIDPYNDWPYNPGAGLVKPDIAAPGTNVNSLVPPQGYSGNTWSGTSMACPHLAGVAALMLEKNPSLTPESIDAIIEQSAVDLGVAGKDNIFGSGLVNAYEAVQHTPTTQVANLVQTAVLPDPAGDQVLDPGIVSPIAFTLTNNSTVVTATNVQATLSVVSNPYVTVVDGSASFPDIPAHLGTGDNTADPFTLDVAAGTPQGYQFTMLLTVTCDGGFSRTFDLEHFAGLPELLTHNVGGVFGSVTDQGILGYLSDDQTVGDGFGLAGAGSALFLGSFWGGNTTLYICNRDYHGQGAGIETYEWVTRQSPNGRVRDLGATGSDQTFSAAFTDSGHANPRGFVVEQTSYAYASSPNDQFVILEYHVTNAGPYSVPTYWMGVFCDWDVADAASNVGSSDVDRHAIWMTGNTGGPYYGLTLLGDAPPENVTFINNPTYVYPNSAIDDGNKLRFLRSLITVHDTPTPDDWSMCCSAGPFAFEPGAEHTAAFAMVYGATLEDFLANVDAAKAVYNPSTPVTDELPVKMFHLAQNTPNPFNPVTSLKYEVATPGLVDLAIYDVSGQRVRTLVNEERPVGQYSVTWDGTGDAGQHVASGVYFAKYRSGNQQQTRKMTLVK